MPMHVLIYINASQKMLPSDPFILLSYVNTKLRDEYPSLAALCDDLDLNRTDLEAKLAAVGFTYLPAANQFR